MANTMFVARDSDMSDIQYGHESNRPMHIVAATKHKKKEEEM